MEFKSKFIAFVDILGFKKMVEEAEAGSVTNLEAARVLLKEFGSPGKREELARNGSHICPQSKYVQRDLDFRVVQISDSLLVSCEVSPAGAINIVEHCWRFVFCLLQKGFACRGYITLGTISHQDDADIVGTGVHEVIEKEKNVHAFKQDANERGTPFVEIDQRVCDYIDGSGDWCVNEMFSRCINSDGEFVAIFPFQRLAHRFVIASGRKFDAERERKANQNVRVGLERLKERVKASVDISNPSAVQKSYHYVRALNGQLKVCDRTDEFIAQMDSVLPM